MNKNVDIFRIQSNNVLPSRGKVLISEPFLRDATFGRSVVLLVDHSPEGSMGLVLNKELPLFVNDIVNEFKYLDEIPLFKGGPVGTDTLFYLHTLSDVEGALPIGKEMYLNGDFTAVKKYILQGNPVEGNIRFFLGYSGWTRKQLEKEIEENTWIISKEVSPYLLSEKAQAMWRTSMKRMGSKYKTWSRFPQVPSLN